MPHDGSAGTIRDAGPAASPTGGSSLPLIGICLLALGAILLVQQLWLDVEWLGTAAVALARAVVWVTALYVGMLITLRYIPALILSAIVSMLIAGRRAIVDHAWGWPLWLSGLLVLLVGLTVVNPSEGRAVGPVELIALGAGLLAGVSAGPSRDRNVDARY